MTDHIDKTVADALQRLNEYEAQVADTKRLVNQILGFAGRPPMFAEIESAGSTLPLNGDEYYGQRQSTAARMVLERRKDLNLGPASLEDLFSTLIEGGYCHEARSDDMAKKSLYNMLTQNTSMFHRLPNGLFGLASWYPNPPKKRRSKRRSNQAEDSADQEGDDEPEAQVGSSEEGSAE